MPELSKTTQKLLERAGWFPGRRIDISRYEEVLRTSRSPVHECVREFLSEFGGLHVETLKKGRDFHADPCLAASEFYIDDEGLSEYNITVGAALCCVGVASRAHMMLLMDQSGRMYGVVDDLIYVIGDTPHAALELLCSGEPLREFEPGSTRSGL